jgi:hypothetical protein
MPPNLIIAPKQSALNIIYLAILDFIRFGSIAAETIIDWVE